jgi:hypothetical protein
MCYTQCELWVQHSTEESNANSRSVYNIIHHFLFSRRRAIHGQQSRRSHKDEIASAQLYGQKVTRNGAAAVSSQEFTACPMRCTFLTHTEKEHLMIHDIIASGRRTRCVLRWFINFYWLYLIADA